jgi:hypothetical protein
MNIMPLFPERLQDFCAPAPRPGEYLLERRFAEIYAAARGIPLKYDELLEEIRQWCEASGIGGHGGSVSFSGRRGGREYRGTATRFRDELSILIHAEGEGRRRYRIPGLWSDYSWLVLYQEPLSGEWRSWPGAAKESALTERDRTTEEKAGEGFDWVCRRRIISRVRLFRGECLVKEYFARPEKTGAGDPPGPP